MIRRVELSEKSRDFYSKKNEDKRLPQSDFTLLAELEDNARQPLSKLANKLRISQQLLSYRLRTLKTKNILSGFYTQINFPMFGYTKYRTMVRISSYSQQKEKEIVEYLMHHPNVQWLVECGGKWDFMVNFLAKNVVQFDNFLKAIRNKFPRQIQNFDIFIVFESIELGRSYFIKSYRDTKKLAYFGRDYKPTKVDGADLKILNLISENARMTSAEIAEQIEVSPNTISSRIKKMIERGIIRGFKPLIHLENIGYMTYKIPFKFQNYTEQREEEIIDYLKTDVRITGIIKLVGQWDFEIEFEVDSRQAMLDLTRNFRDKFKDVIKEFEIIPLYHEYKYNFFPGDLCELSR
jgi:DNA-binding Lrp family transcriptional regulator